MIKFLNTFTTQTQVCIVLVLILLVVLASGYIGWTMGWQRAIEYMEKCIDKRLEGGENK